MQLYTVLKLVQGEDKRRRWDDHCQSSRLSKYDFVWLYAVGGDFAQDTLGPNRRLHNILVVERYSCFDCDLAC